MCSIKNNKRISKLLKSTCAQCGSCCTDPIIEVTHHDLRRLVDHLKIPADTLIKLYRVSDFNEVDENDLIELSYGKRKIALRKNQDGTCIFLTKNKTCSAYKARPLSCRTFPIDVLLDEDNDIIDLELSDVIRDKFIRCKRHQGKGASFKDFITLSHKTRDETASYWRKVKRWNRKTERGGKSDFLNFLKLTYRG